MAFKSLTAAMACALAACRTADAAGAGPAAKSAPAAEVTRVLLSRQELAGSPGFESRLYLIEFPPGAESKPHVHPSPGLGYVLEGTFESSFDDGPVTTARAGDSFVDTPGVTHHFRNPDSRHRLRFVISGTFRKEEPLFRPAITIEGPGLYPETVEVNPLNGRFLVGSLREGAVYEVAPDGASRRFIEDDWLTAVLGIAVDARTNRLLVTTSDLGNGVRRSAKGPRKEAGLAIYDLATGRLLRHVDLSQLVPGRDHLMNGVTVDDDGNAYVTDSFSPAIYKVDPAGAATVFLQDAEFDAKGINLNGAVFHQGGYLLVVMKSSGALYRVPLSDPRRFSKVALVGSPAASGFIGGDGLLLTGPDRLVLVANQTPGGASNAAFVLETADGWASARVVESIPLGNVYPTSCAARDGKLYALTSHLNEWLATTDATRDSVLRRGRLAELREIGVVTSGPNQARAP